MTTVAYKAGILAGDTRVTSGEGDTEIVEPENIRKVFKLPNGTLIGMAGEVARMQEIIRELTKNPDRMNFVIKKKEEFEAIVVYPDGVVRVFDGEGWTECSASYHAIGGGQVPAKVAMRCGKSAVQAIKIASEFHAQTGGKVLSVKLDNIPPQKKKEL